MDQKLEFQKKRNSNFFWVVPISFSNETRWIQIFCPDYLFFVSHMNEHAFGKTIFRFWNFARVKATTQNPKCSAFDFAVRLHNFPTGPTMPLDWWCEHVHCPLSKSLCDQVSRPFFCPGSWLLATLCFVAIKPERVLVFLEVIFVGVSSNQFYFCPESSFLWFVFFSSSGIFSLKSFFGNSKVFWKPVSFFLHMFFWHFFLWEYCFFWSQFQFFSLGKPCFWNSCFKNQFKLFFTFFDAEHCVQNYFNFVLVFSFGTFIIFCRGGSFFSCVCRFLELLCKAVLTYFNAYWKP